MPVTLVLPAEFFNFNLFLIPTKYSGNICRLQYVRDLNTAVASRAGYAGTSPGNIY